MVDFEVRRDGTLEDGVFDVAPLTDTANPFGDFVVVKIDDRGGQKFEQYERGTKIEIDILEDSVVSSLSINSGETVTTASGTTDSYSGTVANAGTYSNAGSVSLSLQQPKFTGYVVERREAEQQGSDTLEVEAYSFDQFLRRNTVSTDLTGKTIPEALQSIVDNDSPVTYNSSKVEVVDDQELTRSFRGEPVEEVLRDLAFKSGNENFGVDDSLEFFFRPRESVHIDRGIDNTQWFRYDIPELGKEVVNEVEVWYSDGNESVIVDAPTDKLDLQDNLGLANPGTQRAELQRPQITDTQDAEDVGRRYLQFRNATLSGTVTTFGLYEAEPGDTINIEIKPRGINSEFVIASVEYRWGVDETTLTIVEKRGDQDDILFELNDSVKRQELEGADRDAPSNRVTTTNATALFDVIVDADGNTPDAVKFVNAGRNAVRDAWTGDGNPDIDTISIGVDGTGLSRSNSSLGDVVATIGAATSLPTASSVEFSGIVTTGTIREIGLETSNGTLICRAVFPSGIQLDGEINITLDVSNDNDVQRSVLTNDGQTAVRDVLADNNPNLPTDYAYGSDGSIVNESDTALGNQLKQISIDNVLTQKADLDTEWENITEIDSTDPVGISNSQLELLQTAFVGEAEANAQDTVSDSSYSDGAAAEILQGVGSSFDFAFTNEYDIPQSNAAIYFRGDRAANDTVNAVDIFLDGTLIGFGDEIPIPNTTSPEWASFNVDTDIPAGNHTVTVEYSGFEGNTEMRFDVIAVVDERYVKDVSNLDNTLNTASGYLDDPGLYPQSYSQPLATATTRRNITEGTFNSTWNNTTNNQFVEISPNGSNYTRFDNTSNGSYSFSSSTQSIDVNLGFSRYPVGVNSQSATPRFGYNGQKADLWELFVDPDTPSPDDIGVTNARAIVPPNSGLNGETVREAGLKSGSTLLTRHQLAEFVVQQDQRLASSESTKFTGDE